MGGSSSRLLSAEEKQQMEGDDKENKHCLECGGDNPRWISVTLGVFICENCCSAYRSLGFIVRSIDVDTWSTFDCAKVKVGGNSRAKAYFAAHNIGDQEIKQRYNTTAAAKYIKHIVKLANGHIKNPNAPLPECEVESATTGDVDKLQRETVELSVKCNATTTIEGDGDKVATVVTDEEHSVLVSVSPPAGQMRTPADICCVIDISGSMGTNATMKNAEGGVEGHGLTLLDVVKHAVRTISQSLSKNDRLAIVTYSTYARVDMNLTYMDNAAKQKVGKLLDNMKTEDCTNIWGGLQEGLEVLRKGAKPHRNLSLLLLTDGQPSEHTAQQMIDNFKQYKDNHVLPCAVSTFGFGCQLDSQLLVSVAEEGNGMFSFIPDCSFVGTTFVNAVSNVLSTMGNNVSVSFEPKEGVSIVRVMGDHKSTTTTWGAMVNLPSLQYGQTSDVVVKVKIPVSFPKDEPFLDVTFKYTHWKFGDATFTASVSEQDAKSPEVEVQRRRHRLVEDIHRLMKTNGAENACKPVVADLVADLMSGTDDREKGMLADVIGQVKEAISREYYGRWGKHYLPSLARAHQLQQSNNFKDPGIQFYGGVLFNKLRDEVDEIFCKLPPPTPSSIGTFTPSYSSSNSSQAKNTTPTYAPTFSMAAYNTPTGGCFAGTCLVLMANGMHKRVANITKGDKVATLNNQQAEVMCVIKIHSNTNQTADLVELDGGLLVTPYHPIKIDGKWRFPCDVAQPTQRYCPAVYNFVLKADSTHHVMVINGVTCVTLAHNYTEDVVRHAYFGTQKIVDDLCVVDGWQHGFVELQSGCFGRDQKTGLVNTLHTGRPHLVAA